MKSLFLIPFFLLSSLPVVASSLQQRETTCNARYNNLGIISPNVKCSAWFSAGRLYRVKWFYPKTNKWYDFSVNNKKVSYDPRWKECVRYTFEEGNQWQLCTVPSPDQLKIK